MFKVFTISILLTIITLASGQVLKTGQTLSYDENGNIVADGSIKDDGYYQIGATRSYSRSSSGVVTDNTTGLEWQDDVDSVAKPWLTQANYADGNYSDTSGDTATTYCSELSLDGGEWRLPSIEELETLVDDSNYNPSVTENVFQYVNVDSIPRKTYYWSSTTHTNYTLEAWVVGFLDGLSRYHRKDDSYYNVRCVRGKQLETSNLSRSGEIVTDSITRLQWQDDVVVKTTQRTWIEAIDYCEKTLALGGHDDWRLPNRKELFSIADRSKYNPSLNDVFQNISSSRYWSSTTYSDVTFISYFVDFLGGSSSVDSKDYNCYVRCVRGGQFDTPASLPPVIMYLLN